MILRTINRYMMLWPFYVIGLIVIALIWALSHKPVIVDHPPKSPAEIEKQKMMVEHLEAIGMTKQFVLSQLKAPSTAKFASVMDFSAGKDSKGQWQVIGFVDSQNSFGAMLRTRFVCVLEKTGDRWQLVKLTTE